MNLLIMAAGHGRRLKPITDKIPKPALPILNVPMIFWNSAYFKNLNIDQVAVNTFHLEDALRDQLSTFSHNFIFCSDGPELLGTGGGITRNKDLLSGSEDFWVINGDTLFLSETPFLEEALKRHQQTGALCTLIACDHPGVGSKFGGIWVSPFGKVMSIGKSKPSDAYRGYHFTGFRILSKKIFKEMPPHGPHEFFDTINQLLQKKERIEISIAEGEFFETGNEADFIKTHRTLLKYFEQGKYPQYFSQILGEHSPSSRLNPSDFMVKFRDGEAPEKLFCEERLRIFEGIQSQGFLVTGKNVTVRENCTLKDVVILGDIEVLANSQYSNRIIYENMD